MLQMMNQIEAGIKTAFDTGAGWFASSGVMAAVGGLLILLDKCSQ